MVQNEKKNSFGGSPKIKIPSKGPPKKKLRSVNLTRKKNFFCVFPVKPCYLKKISSVNFGKKIKIAFGGSPKKNFVRENQHHAPQMIYGQPLMVFKTGPDILKSD